MEVNRCPYCMEKMGQSKVCPCCGKHSDELRQSEFALQPGTILQGKYLIGAVLGQGGFGITYMGYDKLLEIKVAVKEYYPSYMVSRSRTGDVLWSSKATPKEEGCSSFLKEARKMAKLMSIPEVVRVLNILQENNTAYIVMDFVEGITLKEKLKRDGIMSEADAAALLGPIAEALDRVHRQGIIHRDISPDNIMIDREGRAKLLDLGAAKEMDMRSSEDRQSSQMIHKDGFSPPEQYMTGGSIGAWTDVYAMSATFLYCVTGRLVPQAMNRILNGEAVEYTERISPSVREVLEKGLAVRPDERYRTMGEFWSDLTGGQISGHDGRTESNSGDTVTVGESESAEAMYRLGLSYDNGQGVEQNDAKAVEWYTKAAMQGHALAQNNLGVCYENGQGVEKNYAKAAEWYVKAAAQGDAAAQNNMGICYKNGRGVEQNDSKAAEWYTKAALQGYARAQYNLGVCYEKGRGVEKNYAKAAEWYTKAALQGYAPAQYNLGVCYDNGQGVEQNDAKAVEWYTKAAMQGHALAQNNLGACYENGQGVEKNYAKAAEWYAKAAAQGNAAAQNNLGVCYENGWGVEKNYAKAAEWYMKAAMQGYAAAQTRLGICYRKGQGVEQNYAKAVEWYSKAAAQGYTFAQNNLGVCYENGWGVEKSNRKAAEWYAYAAAQGNVTAQDNLRRLNK